MRPRLAITGAGIVSPAGVGAEALDRAYRSGRSLLAPLPLEMVRGLPVSFGARTQVVPAEEESGMAEALARLAARLALEQAGIDPGSFPVGLALGTALGALDSAPVPCSGGRKPGLLHGPEFVPISYLARALAGGLHLSGPVHAFSVTCLSGIYALEQAWLDIALGRARAVLAGGVDALTRIMQGGFCSLGALARSRESGTGITLGEAAAFLCLEEESSALERSAPILGIVASNALAMDACHLTSPDETGRGMTAAALEALEEAGLEPDDVPVVGVTALGSGAYERMFDRVIAALYPPGAYPTRTTFESVTGHVLAASGPMGIIHALSFLKQRGAGRALVLTVGFGGQNGATIVLDGERAPLGRPIETPAQGVLVRSWASASTAPEDLEDQFGVRWNRRRRIEDSVRPLVEAVARALEKAGWWRPTTGIEVPGGLVVACDMGSIEYAGRFDRSLGTKRWADVSPADFLFTLPSSPAAVLGLLFGLPSYQATIPGLEGVGLEALDHALDLVRSRRLQRAVVAGFTQVGPEVEQLLARGGSKTEGPFCLAVALCLEASSSGLSLDGARGQTDVLLQDLPQAYRHLAAPTLLAVARLLDSKGSEP